MLPRVLLDRRLADTDFPTGRGDSAESIADFMVAHGILSEPEGEPLISVSSRCSCRRKRGAGLKRWSGAVIAGNHLADQCEPGERAPDRPPRLWQTRRRIFDSDEKGFAIRWPCWTESSELVGKDLACHVVFSRGACLLAKAQSRRVRSQKNRQDQLGLGWANHDHHTFRSSREHFVDLMHALEKLGFERRERYYAGAQAGWGAQILEQPIEGIVAFCDVDLEPEETEIDFSRQPLPPSEETRARSGSGWDCTGKVFSKRACITWNAALITACCASRWPHSTSTP